MWGVWVLFKIWFWARGGTVGCRYILSRTLFLVETDHQCTIGNFTHSITSDLLSGIYEIYIICSIDI